MAITALRGPNPQHRGLHSFVGPFFSLPKGVLPRGLLCLPCCLLDMVQHCLPVVLATACSFRVLLDELESLIQKVQQTSVCAVYTVIKRAPTAVQLDCDEIIILSNHRDLRCT